MINVNPFGPNIKVATFAIPQCLFVGILFKLLLSLFISRPHVHTPSFIYSNVSAWFAV